MKRKNTQDPKPLRVPKTWILRSTAVGGSKRDFPKHTQVMPKLASEYDADELKDRLAKKGRPDSGELMVPLRLAILGAVLTGVIVALGFWLFS